MDRKKFIEEMIVYCNTKLLDEKPELPVDAKTKLFETGLINSMKIISLIAYVEKKLKVRIDDDMVTMENFETIGTIAKKFCRNEKKSKK